MWKTENMLFHYNVARLVRFLAHLILRPARTALRCQVHVASDLTLGRRKTRYDAPTSLNTRSDIAPCGVDARVVHVGRAERCAQVYASQW